MKNLNKILTTVFLTTIMISNPINAQDADESAPEPTFNFSGSVDTYFRSSFTEDPVAPGTSFANLNGFSLGMANFIVSYEGEKSRLKNFSPKPHEARKIEPCN